MSQDQNIKQPEKKKGFLARFFDRLDQKLAEKAKNSCCSSRKGKNSSCC